MMTFGRVKNIVKLGNYESKGYLIHIPKVVIEDYGIEKGILTHVSIQRLRQRRSSDYMENQEI